MDELVVIQWSFDNYWIKELKIINKIIHENSDEPIDKFINVK